MRMWTVKIIILLLFCYACLSTESRKVRFVSKNFYNILHWDPVKSAPPGQSVLYSVLYKSDVEGQSYVEKKECQNITALSCNLTDETPSNYDVHYKAQVKLANGRIHGCTISFKPIADTIFGPPSLSNYTTVSSLHVSVTLPLGPNRTSIEDIIINSKKGPSKTVMLYNLHITHPKWAAHMYENSTGHFNIDLKKNQTEYCGYVVYKTSAEWGRLESEKAFFCAKLQDDPLKILPWLLVGATLLVVIIIISVASMCCYVKGGKTKDMPEILVSPFIYQHKTVEFGDKNLVISKPEFNTSQGEKTVYATIQVKPNPSTASAGGYSPQDIIWHSSFESSVGSSAQSCTSNPVDTSRQPSESYGAVVVHVSAEENPDGEQDTTKDGSFRFFPGGESMVKGGMNPEHKAPPLPALDPESEATKPLLLRTVRDPSGQLVLPSLALELQSNTGERERNPLLSDIMDCSREGPSLASLRSFDSSEWSDSGCDDSTVNTPTHPYCNTNYSPSQPVVAYLQQECQSTPFRNDAIFETGCKGNGIPAVLQGILSKDRTNSQCTWSSSIMEEEDGEKDENGQEDGSREILLGGWGLKIQE